MVNYADLIGIPFKFGTRGPDNFDCYGLVIEMAKRDGVTLPDFGFSTDQALISAMMASTMPQWERTEKTTGAVVLFRVGRFVSHVGYMVDEDFMVHTWEQSGGVTLQRIDQWTQRIIGFYKHVGI